MAKSIFILKSFSSGHRHAAPVHAISVATDARSQVQVRTGRAMEIDIIPLFAMYYISIILHIVCEIPPASNDELWLQFWVVLISASAQFYLTLGKYHSLVTAAIHSLTILVFSSNIFLFTDLVKALPTTRPRLVWTAINSLYLLGAFISLSRRPTIIAQPPPAAAPIVDSTNQSSSSSYHVNPLVQAMHARDERSGD